MAFMWTNVGQAWESVSLKYLCIVPENNGSYLSLIIWDLGQVWKLPGFGVLKRDRDWDKFEA